MIKRLFIWLVVTLLCLVILPQIVLAHSPSGMELEYDFEEQQLSVTITHIVGDPNSHYIENVKIWKNDNLIIDQDYTNQPTSSSFTFTYDITANDGDVLKVNAECNRAGNIERQIAVEEPDQPSIDLSVIPSISSIDENTALDFSITITSNGQPLESTDLTVIITSNQGSISNERAKADGQYEFKYTASEVDVDTPETIIITVTKDGYNNGFKQVQFTILNNQPSDGKVPTLDGFISPDEYEFTVSFAGGDYKLHWRLDGEIISMAIEGKTTGWVAIGFEPKKVMEDADMIFGWVTDKGEVKVIDTFSTGEFGPHPPDTELGGTDNIIEFGGTETSSWTIIEFKRLIDTDDDFDNKLRDKGEIDIIWAMGNNDNFESIHSNVGSGTIDLATGEATEDIKLWPVHAVLMALGFIFMLLAILIARTMKNRNWWLNAHRGLNSMGTIFAVFGLIMAIYMVSEADTGHFRVPHAFIGIITIIFVIMSSILGTAQLKAGGKSGLRNAHWGIGYITLVLMLINIISGILLI